nr:ABC transporter ATP-binding protein [Candidatus Sigynarchaeota archaeon]
MQSDPIIEIREVSFRYQNQKQPVIQGISASFYPGTVSLICGPTGSGKTTLIRLMNGLIPHFYEGNMTGDVTIDGINTKSTSTAKLAQIVGMVFQNPDNQLVCSTCEREIAFGPENLGLPRSEIKERLESAIKVLGIESIRDSSPNELSGGQKQKVAIAAALALKPKILVFDEPSSNLDIESTARLVDTIEMINTKLHATIIIVEHRLEPFLRIATHLVCIADGKILLHGETANVINDDVFYDIGVQVPVLLKIFHQLARENIYNGPIPIETKPGMELLKKML